jgi:predicted phage baseplate assembly protein
MNESNLICLDERRRHLVREKGLNGLDYLEVSDDQLKLTVYFLAKAPEDLQKENVVIRGGRRIRGIRVIDLRLCIQADPARDDCVILTVDRFGDFSDYTLCLVGLDEQGRPSLHALPGFDPRYACLDFSFKAGCPSDLDCKPIDVCPSPANVEPEIDYLAKDYASFRQLMLDRLALTMPEWRETHVPDIGVALVELLAYTGDQLSYYQDAVATEAYLDTARQRISVRRHARLVDYHMHEGCNARAFVCVATDSRVDLEPAELFFITGKGLDFNKRLLTAEALRGIPGSRYEVFEPANVSPRSVEFRPSDLKYPGCLAVKLRDRENPISEYIYGTFSSETQGMLAEYTGDGARRPGDTLQEALVAEFNRLLYRPGLYHRSRFAAIDLGDNIRTFLDSKPHGDELARLNRILLQRAYPQELATIRQPDDLICLDPNHNEIRFYTWGDEECCLGRGATSAVLADTWLPMGGAGEATTGIEECRRLRALGQLQPGDVLIFEEIKGPKTGNPADADPEHRHAVSLTQVLFDIDPLTRQPIVHIDWAEDDALPFPLCLSAIGPAPECPLLENISLVRGNVILVDHGRSIGPEDLGTVAAEPTEPRCEGEGQAAEVEILPERFTAQLEHTPLTFGEPVAAEMPASAMMDQYPRQALPQIALAAKRTLGESEIVRTWSPTDDLLNSQSADRNFVVELDEDGRGHLRFGNGELGRKPEAGTTFLATYRTGNGPAGNVGAESISHLVQRSTTLSGVQLTPRNPLPARGGIAPEPMADVKLFAPHAFRSEIQRAITAQDYAHIVMRDFKAEVQRAAAKLRWTGSWVEVLVAVDPKGEVNADPELLNEIAKHLYRYRRMGHDVVVAPARYVALAVELTVCVLPNYLRGQVKAAVLEVLSNRMRPDGKLGFFHPDRLSFGEGVAASSLVAAVQNLLGVESVFVDKLKRQFEDSQDLPEDGILRFGPLEVARLDNDPNRPENGVLQLKMGGGR